MSDDEHARREVADPYDLVWTLAGQEIMAGSADEAVVLDVRSGSDYTLRGLSLRVWRLLDRGATAGEIRREVLREYQGNVTRCETDVTTFLRQLAIRGLVVARLRHRPFGPDGGAEPELPAC